MYMMVTLYTLDRALIVDCLYSLLNGAREFGIRFRQRPVSRIARVTTDGGVKVLASDISSEEDKDGTGDGTKGRH